MLDDMDSSRDASPSGSPIRHLRAVEAGFLRTDDRTDDDPPELAGDDFTRRQLDLFDHLIEAVGSADALWRLDVKPLPDEPFDWTAVQPEDKEFVAEVLALSDHCCEEAFDFEFRTAARRILARVARNDPRPFRRHPHAARCAASLVFLVGSANGDFGRGGRLPSSLLWRWFGVGDCAGRARTLRRAAGLGSDGRYDGWSDPTTLGDPALLHSWMRGRLVDQRDRLLDVAERRRTWSVIGDDGRSARVVVRARPTKVVHSAKAVLRDSGRAIVLVGLGEQLEDAEFLSLTVPDAHDLVRHVQHALDTALPRVEVW
jgi:hypothetical protein